MILGFSLKNNLRSLLIQDTLKLKFVEEDQLYSCKFPFIIQEARRRELWTSI